MPFVDAVDKLDWTPMVLATFADQLDVVRDLVTRSAVWKPKTGDGLEQVVCSENRRAVNVQLG